MWESMRVAPQKIGNKRYLTTANNRYCAFIKELLNCIANTNTGDHFKAKTPENDHPR
jgi:hypothetical protein